MQHKKKFPKVGAFQEHAIHVSKIRKLEEACDSAVAQYIEDKINDVHNPKIDEILKDKLDCAEKSIQSSIRRIGELEKAVAPTPTEAEKFKKQVQDFQDMIKKFSADAERMRTMFHNGLKYDGKNDEPCDMFPENNGGIHPLHDFPKNRREEMIEHLVTSRVSDVTNQHPDVLKLKKELEKEKLEKQTYKDALAEKEYQAFQKERNKARNGSGSSTHQILELMVVEYKNAVLESKDKKRIYKKVFWNLKRFKNFRQAMCKKYGKCFFPTERSMEGYIRIAETELYYETKKEEFNITDSGRPTNEFKNYIPKYPDDIPPEPPPKTVSLNEEDWSSKSAPQIIKAPDVDHDLN